VTAADEKLAAVGEGGARVIAVTGAAAGSGGAR
jgi:hypothetical protein